MPLHVLWTMHWSEIHVHNPGFIVSLFRLKSHFTILTQTVWQSLQTASGQTSQPAAACINKNTKCSKYTSNCRYIEIVWKLMTTFTGVINVQIKNLALNHNLIEYEMTLLNRTAKTTNQEYSSDHNKAQTLEPCNNAKHIRLLKYQTYVLSFNSSKYKWLGK